MDKVTIVNDEKNHLNCVVHKMPSRMAEICKRYGLWICQSNRNMIPGPRGGSLTIRPRYFEFYCISHLINGRGFLWTPDAPVKEFGPGQAVMTTPGTIQCYGGYNDCYDEDTVCFTGSVADGLARCGVLKCGIFNLGKARKLIPIIDLAHDPSEKSQILANMALQNLLFEVYRDKIVSEEDGGRHGAFEELIQGIKDGPSKWWTVEEMAAFCNMSPTHFNRTFKRYTGLSPKTYVDRLKIQMAAERIANTDESLSQVAEFFGYTDPFHFSRRFKQMAGDSPANYRRRSRRS